MRKMLLLVLRVSLLGLFSLPGPLTAATNSVTFKFTRLKEIQCDEEEPFEHCPNDLYPKVEIDMQGLDDGRHNKCCAHSTDFQPADWFFTVNVDTSHTLVPIHVELWDQDDLSADDQIDIANGGKSLDLIVNLGTCTWHGGGLNGALNTQSTSSGTPNDAEQIYFMITTSAPQCADTDGDGLLDIWEKNGYDADGDGIIDVDLKAMGADPNKKDLFLQLDHLIGGDGHTHAPFQAALQLIVQAFANAPVSNPDGSTGIQLHIDVGPIYGAGNVIKVTGADARVVGTFGDMGGGTKIAETGNQIIDYDGAVGNFGVDLLTIQKLNPNRQNIFRYGMFGHQTNVRAAINDCTSGLAKGAPGVNFMVTLGGLRVTTNPGPPPVTVTTPCWVADAGGRSVGSVAEQATALMHEFGHTLGLQHGGNDPFNNKPNYPSVMSYAYFPPAGGAINSTVCAVPNLGGAIPGGCDYSRALLAPLNENGLDECLGYFSPVLTQSVDINGNRRLEGTTCPPPNNANISANVNLDTSADANNNGIQDGTEPPLLSTLAGFQDWNALVYDFKNIFDFTTAGTPSSQLEPDPELIEKSRSALSQTVQPKLKLISTGPSDSGPGQALAYNIRLENSLADGARGPALNVVVTHTKPDLSTQAFNLGHVALEAVINTPSSYSVPCSTNDGVVLTSKFAARGSDLINNLIETNTSTATVIHTPVMMFLENGTASVNAGEAITYTIRYENTGSGPAFNVLIRDIVARDVYYSLALDQGIGPRPSTVTLNGDGTRTLVWTIGTVPAHSGPRTIAFTARPTLLALGGTLFTDNASLTFQKGAACPADVLPTSASTVITVVALRREHEPHIYLHWAEHAAQEPAETLARIQATDQRFDGNTGVAADGALDQSEVTKAFARGNLWHYIFHVNRPIHLEHHLLALYFNLATRRVNADSTVEHEHDTPPGLTNVRDAALNAQATLAIPYSEATEGKYHSAKEVVEEINH